MPGDLFSELHRVYDAMIDWPTRLAREEPFYRRRFADLKLARLIDVACGTGHHAAMFHRWGMQVQGADLSPAMIEAARGRFGESPGLQWAVRGFDQPIAAPEPFDVAVCVGNSLALAPDLATVGRSVQQMLAAIRPGGMVIVHVLNLGRLAEGPCVWQKCLRVDLGEREAIAVKGVHRAGTGGFVDLLVAGLEGAILHQESIPLLDLSGEFVADLFHQAGVTRIEQFGDYADHPYDRATSVDLLLTAWK